MAQQSAPIEQAADVVSPWLITNNAAVFGLVMMILGCVFWTSNLKQFRTFYKIVPMLLLCYFLPSLLTLFGFVDPDDRTLYTVATRYLLPAALVLLTMSVDLKEIFRLGPKALIMFLTGTVGVIIGGPLAILIVAQFRPDIVGGEGFEATWRGLSTVAGSWIGGGANQLAMKETFLPLEKMTQAQADSAGALWDVMLTVDIVIAEIWMMFLLLGVGKAKAIDRFFKADASSVERLQKKMEDFSLATQRIPTAADLMVIAAIGFGATAIAHLAGGWLAEQCSNNAFLISISLNSAFFWIIVIATAIGVGLSFTRCKQYEGAGASKLGTVFIFILVGVIGLGMDIRKVVEHPGLFVVGGIWMAIHVGLLVFVGWLIRAPYFFLAVGSKANIGGAASAPVVAAAFHPSLAPVGVLLAVLGYALGTGAAWLCAMLMKSVAPI